MDENTNVGRRAVLGSLAAVGLGAGLARGRASGVWGSDDSSDTMGYDHASGRYVLPDLPYGYDALEPAIDEQTMRIHHGKHHAGYVRGLNGALKELSEIRAGNGNAGLIEHWTKKLSFHAGGHINHTLFWSGMAPAGKGGGGSAGGSLGAAIVESFGSFDGFADQFKAAARSVEGSGWAWLVRDAISGGLLILQMHNQQHSVFAGAAPLLGIDVWEHAYYLRYQNRRAEYVDRFMDVVNWGEIGRRFEAAAG
ncbi:MAG: superoxide dismutase [Planctomycetota bacterium]